MDSGPRLKLTITAQVARVFIESGNRLYQEQRDFQGACEHQRLVEELKKAVQEETGKALEDLSPKEILGPAAYDVYVELWCLG